MTNQSLELSVQRRHPLRSTVTFFSPIKKLSILFLATPRGVCFSRAPPFVERNKTGHENAYYQPCSRFWRLAPVLPSATLLDKGTKPLESTYRPSPDHAPNPKIRPESLPDGEKPQREKGV